MSLALGLGAVVEMSMGGIKFLMSGRCVMATGCLWKIHVFWFREAGLEEEMDREEVSDSYSVAVLCLGLSMGHLINYLNVRCEG